MLLTTGLGRRIFGIPAAQDQGGGLRLAARLFGIRNVALGAWTLLARDMNMDERRLCYRLNLAVDSADIAVLGWAGVSGSGLRRAALMGGALGPPPSSPSSTSSATSTTPPVPEAAPFPSGPLPD